MTQKNSIQMALGAAADYSEPKCHKKSPTKAPTMVKRHTDKIADKIKKEKLYTTNIIKNNDTGRMNKQFQCTFCFKKFDKVSNVKDHIRSHLDDRPYNCTACGCKFS